MSRTETDEACACPLSAHGTTVQTIAGFLGCEEEGARTLWVGGMKPEQVGP